MNKKFLLIGLIVAFIAYAGYTFTDTVTPYVDIKQAKAAASNVQVKGLLNEKAPAPHMDGEDFVFGLKDENDDSSTMEVRYRGTKPDQFDEAFHIVAIGKYEGSEFKANKLLIKCPSKYESEKRG